MKSYRPDITVFVEDVRCDFAFAESTIYLMGVLPEKVGGLRFGDRGCIIMPVHDQKNQFRVTNMDWSELKGLLSEVRQGTRQAQFRKAFMLR